MFFTKSSAVNLENSFVNSFMTKLEIPNCLRMSFFSSEAYPTSLASKSGALFGPSGTTTVRLFDTLAGIPNGMDYHTRRNVRRLSPTGQVFWLDTPYDYMFGT